MTERESDIWDEDFDRLMSLIEDYDNPDEGTCAICSAAIHYEESQWLHSRIDDSSHTAIPR